MSNLITDLNRGIGLVAPADAARSMNGRAPALVLPYHLEALPSEPATGQPDPGIINLWVLVHSLVGALNRIDRLERIVAQLVNGETIGNGDHLLEHLGLSNALAAEVRARREAEVKARETAAAKEGAH